MNNKKRLGRSLEKKVVDMAGEEGINATVQPLSGQLEDFPGDVAFDGFLAECKVRAEKVNASGDRYIHIDTRWIEKITKESKQLNKMYGVVLFRMKNRRDIYAVLRFEDFLRIVPKP
jgi:hypothetical protein